MDLTKIEEIFFPYNTEKVREIKATKRRFAYYTNAETAYRIISGSQIWMRSTATMNDFLEVEHGFECLNSAYKSESGVAFKNAIDSIFPDLTEEAVKNFNEWLPHLRNDTYITCFSEHLDNEDKNGRLSMWRAYGGSSGVAIVFKNDALFIENESIGIYVSAVAYLEAKELEVELKKISDQIIENKDIVSQLSREHIKTILFNIFRFGMLCTKHSGFSEEREWRAITCPLLDTSVVRESSIEVIKGTPQVIQKLNLKNIPEKNIDGLSLNQIIDRVIIGPCEFTGVVWKAIYQALKDAGFKSPEEIIHVSDVPLRTQ